MNGQSRELRAQSRYLIGIPLIVLFLTSVYVTSNIAVGLHTVLSNKHIPFCFSPSHWQRRKLFIIQLWTPRRE